MSSKEKMRTAAIALLAGIGIGYYAIPYLILWRNVVLACALIVAFAAWDLSRQTRRGNRRINRRRVRNERGRARKWA